MEELMGTMFMLQSQWARVSGKTSWRRWCPVKTERKRGNFTVSCSPSVAPGRGCQILGVARISKISITMNDRVVEEEPGQLSGVRVLYRQLQTSWTPPPRPPWPHRALPRPVTSSVIRVGFEDRPPDSN